MGHSEVVDGVIKDGLWDPYSNVHMGTCAELCAKCAQAPADNCVMNLACPLHNSIHQRHAPH